MNQKHQAFDSKLVRGLGEVLGIKGQVNTILPALFWNILSFVFLMFIAIFLLYQTILPQEDSYEK